MQVKMKGILASPEVCADADTVIPVNSKLGQALIKGGYAQEDSTVSARENTALHPSAQAQSLKPVRATNEQIKEIFGALDLENPDHWLGSGKPNPEVIRELTGDLSLTSADLSERFPEFRHPGFKEAVGDMVDLLKATAPEGEETSNASDGVETGENSTAENDEATQSETAEETAAGDREKATDDASDKPVDAAAENAPVKQDEKKPAKKAARGTRSSAP